MMHLDLDSLTQFVPINTLEREQVESLARHVQVEQHRRGAQLFRLGDKDPHTLFLLDGQIQLTAADGQQQQVDASQPEARHALASLKPRRYSGEVVSAQASIARIDSDMLDRLLNIFPSRMPEDKGMEVQELTDMPDTIDAESMLTLLQSPAFMQLPASNIQAVLEHMETLQVTKGQQIITQDEPGDYFYLIKQGVAEVTRRNGNQEIRLATLHPPQSFGEEALISERPRNASVRMQSDGVLMRLSHQDFQDHLRAPLLDWVDIKRAGQLIKGGAVRLDVRTEAEHQASNLKGVLNIPLYLIRLKMRNLDKNREYVLFCDTGSRSAAAGFLMGQQGFKVHVLEGGLAALLD